ncbi:unnamed protein product [Caenorhabditis nigoni]
MNAKDLRLPEAESPITLTTPSDNLPLLLKQMAHLDAHRTHLIQNCSYDGDPTIEEISCMNQNLNFRCSPLAHDLPSLEWAFFTALASFDYLKKLQIVQNLDIKDRSILLKQAFSTHSLLSEGFDAFQKKQSCLTFPNGSDCFLSEAITVPADFENRIRCRLVGRMCDLKMTYEEKLLLSVIFTCDPALNGLSERGQSLSSSHRNVHTSLLVQRFDHPSVWFATDQPINTTVGYQLVKDNAPTENCSYDGDPTIEEISCMNQSLEFRSTPTAENQPATEGFLTGLTSIDFLKKLQIVQKLDVLDRSILLRHSFIYMSLLSAAHYAMYRKMSSMTFPDGSDCFQSDAITTSTDFENRMRCRLVGRICDLKMTYSGELL